MPDASRFIAASGTSLFDAAFLAEARDGSRWVGVLRRAPPDSPTPLDLGFRLGTRERTSGLWRDPEGGLWVCGPRGVRTNRDPWGPESDLWELRELDAALEGITGVDRRCVLTWGVRASDGASVLRLFNGARWNPLPGPGFAVRSCAILGPDRIWVCGEHTARWDGAGWAVLDDPGLAIHATMDAAPLLLRPDGRFGRVTAEGFVHLGSLEGAVAIAAWAGAIWLGAGPRGLWVWEGGTLRCVRADRRCVGLEAHPEALLIACTDVIASTEDGERFPAAARGALEPLVLPR